jgi:hypothetical protein
MPGKQLSQTHEHNRTANDGPHARKRRLTSSEDGQEPDGNRQRCLHPAASAVHRTQRRCPVELRQRACSGPLVAHTPTKAALLEALDDLLDLGESR